MQADAGPPSGRLLDMTRRMLEPPGGVPLSGARVLLARGLTRIYRMGEVEVTAVRRMDLEIVVLFFASLVSCSSGPRLTPATPAWNVVQRNLYIYGCMNGDAAIEYGPAATQGYCSCYQSGVEELHPYSWVVDGNSPTLAESEQIKHVEDRCKERVLAQRAR